MQSSKTMKQCHFSFGQKDRIPIFARTLYDQKNQTKILMLFNVILCCASKTKITSQF